MYNEFPTICYCYCEPYFSIVEVVHACRLYECIRQFGDLCAVVSSLCFVLTAVKADTGNIGGSLSHEYHIPNTHGEDTLLTCKQ